MKTCSSKEEETSEGAPGTRKTALFTRSLSNVQLRTMTVRANSDVNPTPESLDGSGQCY